MLSKKYDRSRVVKNVSLLTKEENEEVIELLVDKAEKSIKLLGVNNLTYAAEDVVEDIAIIRYNQVGKEGLTSESFGENSVSLSNDLPELLKKKVKSLIGIVIL